jgi:predicted flap endonuclease-1-like 5' DNA nuclease
MSEQKGLLERLKSFLGLSRTSRPESTDDADVTVEREPNTTTEDAVKGTGSATADTASETVESDASAESDSSVVSESDTSDGPTDSAEAEMSAESAESEEADAPASADSSEDSPPVDEIKGIGPTYADRLAEIGIETVADLAAADAADVAEAAQASESRATDWIERATDFE